MAALIHIRGSGSSKVQLTLQAVSVAASSAVLPLEVLLQCWTVMAQVLLLAVLVLGIALQAVGGSQNATAPALSPAELAYKKAVELRCGATHWAHALKYLWHSHCAIAHCPSARVSTWQVSLSHHQRVVAVTSLRFVRRRIEANDPMRMCCQVSARCDCSASEGGNGAPEISGRRQDLYLAAADKAGGGSAGRRAAARAEQRSDDRICAGDRVTPARGAGTSKSV